MMSREFNIFTLTIAQKNIKRDDIYALRTKIVSQ